MKLVLSLCGGGMRGVFTMRFLMHLDDTLRQRTGKGVYHYVDLYAGTSVGSFVVAAFAYEQLTADNLDTMFNHENAKMIMNKTFWDCVLGRFQNRPMYDGQGKRRFLENHFQDVMINECDKKCLFTVYDATNRNPLVIKNWEMGTNSGLEMTLGMGMGMNSTNEKLRDVLDMSSAAPGYFPPVQSSQTGIVGIDGAIFANNPAHIAYANALKLWGENEDIRVLSIGTGTEIIHKKLGTETLGWGSIQWVTKGDLIDRIMDGPEEEVHNLMKTMTSALKHRYYRVNPELESMVMDDVSEEYIEKTKALADKYWGIHGESILKMFLE